MYLNSIAALRAQSPVPPTTEFVVGGHTNPGDRGGGTFIYINSAPPYPDDDGILVHAAPGGYYERLFSGPINVRWFGATGDPTMDDTIAVHKARDCQEFANNGTLYFPKGKYVGAFKFDYKPTNPDQRNFVNITGDGEGSVLMSNASGEPVMTLGYKSPDWPWRYGRVSDITIEGLNDYVNPQAPAIGIQFSNPADSKNSDAGRWVIERVHFHECYIGIYKSNGNIGNHYIDCNFRDNQIGILGQGVDDMHAGCDRYNGCNFNNNTIACIQYLGDAGQVIIDGCVFQYNHTAWAVSIKLTGPPRMTQSAICIRNAWFEGNGGWPAGTGPGGDLEFEGVRSVRIDDCRIMSRIWLKDSSVNLYNCRLESDAGGVGNDHYLFDSTSSLVAYEHRYQSYTTSKVFVNSISYDGANDINVQYWQPTSVWGPLRCVTSTNLDEGIVLSHQFVTGNESFSFLSGGSGTTWAHVTSMRVLGQGSNLLNIPAGSRLICDNVIGVIQPSSTWKYIVWSIHTFLEGDHDDDEDQLFGEIKSGGTILGRVYFKCGQWACSYGMKLVDTTSRLDMRLEFESLNDAKFYMTDYQIMEFTSLHRANAYVNSREFTVLMEG